MKTKMTRMPRCVKDAYHAARSILKEIRIWRLGNEDAFWLEREHEIYRKYKRKYGRILRKGVEQSDRAPSDRVWICWLQGIETAPELIRACYSSVCTTLHDKNITVITDSNVHKFIDIPQHIFQKYRSGIIQPAQYSDFIRVSLLAKWGGTWIDATVLLTGDALPKYTMSLPLFCFKQLNVSNKDVAPIVSSSWYMSAFSNSRILTLTRDMLSEYWLTHNRLENYFIFHIFLALAARRYPDEWAAVPCFNNTTPHELMFELGDAYSPDRWTQIIAATDIHKLTRHLDFGRGTFYQYILDTFNEPGKSPQDCNMLLSE